jgi:hypothetical protein
MTMVDPTKWKAMSRQQKASAILDALDNTQWSNDALFEDFVRQYRNLHGSKGYDLEKDPFAVVFTLYLPKCKTVGEFRAKIRQDLTAQAGKI